ncbi:hypothetical protein GCM10029964_077530 [Kibdelosporangium lantanae]
MVTARFVGETHTGTPGPVATSTVSAGPVVGSRRNMKPPSASSDGRGVTHVTWLFARCASTCTDASLDTVSSGCAEYLTAVTLPSVSVSKNRPSTL